MPIDTASRLPQPAAIVAGSVPTDAQTAIGLLRRDIVAGVLRPETKLKLRILKERYGIGGSPMREALAKLSAEGLVAQTSQRGFRVPALSPAALRDITRSRQLVEVQAVKLAIAHGGAAWEDEIIASYRLLEAELMRRGGQKDLRRIDFELRHHRFHRALIAACPLDAVRAFCDGLYVQATRYRNLLAAFEFTSAVVIDEHRLLMDAVLSRHQKTAASALHDHIGLTADVLMATLQDADSRSTAAPRSGDKTGEVRLSANPRDTARISRSASKPRSDREAASQSKARTARK
jgi:GntR family transcriptional regulator, carbon starvation induced regulator